MIEKYPIVSADGHLADNPIWGIPPAPCNEVRGSLKTCTAERPNALAVETLPHPAR